MDEVLAVDLVLTVLPGLDPGGAFPLEAGRAFGGLAAGFAVLLVEAGGELLEDLPDLGAFGATDGPAAELAAFGDGECEADELCGGTERPQVLAGDPGEERCSGLYGDRLLILRVGADCWSSASGAGSTGVRVTPARCGTLCPTTDRSTNSISPVTWLIATESSS
ncbi:hypothetical protein PUR49_30410 [Streptomyces sp. BE147]|uniref:hypothetical protein n=1 Tax=Streptomyces sp. BE147 TaxID=3002524 RepID=UPI002E79B327|nr:hypothetical protein [Streptomyces sp. BE147]MEE1740779.1 hypothetical protein [Streptomyces sp. BE147]